MCVCVDRNVIRISFDAILLFYCSLCLAYFILSLGMLYGNAKLTPLFNTAQL